MIGIRCPKERDIEELSALFDKTIRHTFIKEGITELQELLIEEIEDKKRITRDYVSNPGKTYKMFIATIDGKIVGSITYGPCNDLIKELSNKAYSHLGEIGTVYVLPEYQGLGVGRALLNTILIALRSSQIDEFTLDSGYKTAQKYWEKRLGSPEINKENYWGSGNSHKIWKKRTDEIAILLSGC